MIRADIFSLAISTKISLSYLLRKNITKYNKGHYNFENIKTDNRVRMLKA